MFKTTYSNEFQPQHFLAADKVSDYLNKVDELRIATSHNYSKAVDNALSTKVLANNIYALENAKSIRLIDDFIREFSPHVEPGYEPVTVLLRHLMRPKLVPNHYYKDSQGVDMPVYKANEHLVKLVLDWANAKKEMPFIGEFI